MLIDRKPNGAGVFCLIGAVLAFFGFIHGPAVGMAVSPMIALSYVLMAVICFGFTKMELEAPDA
jgi:AGZA family xanthine/uracil permease-like MFS transporter